LVYFNTYGTTKVLQYAGIENIKWIKGSKMVWPENVKNRHIFMVIEADERTIMCAVIIFLRKETKM
jgi:hypothetical protein